MWANLYLSLAKFVSSINPPFEPSKLNIGNRNVKFAFWFTLSYMIMVYVSAALYIHEYSGNNSPRFYLAEMISLYKALIWEPNQFNRMLLRAEVR